MISKLSVKRQWFQTAAAKKKFPALVGATGAVLEDADSGTTVRVRVAGRSVSIEPTRAAASGTFRAAEVDDKFRTKVRRVSISHDLLSEVFDPSCAHVPAECVLGGEHSYESSVRLESEPPAPPAPAPRIKPLSKPLGRASAAAEAAEEAEEAAEAAEAAAEAARAAEAAEAAEAAAEAAEAAEAARAAEAAADARLLETVKQVFDRALCVSRHVPVIRLPLASVTFQYLCESSPSRAVLERLGERYLATLQSALRQSEGARRLYATRCVGAGAELRQAVLDGTWE
jgi:chemotaxis protein histidine kinase CheA